MKILYTFLITLITAILFFIPINRGVYNFETAQKTDSSFVTTAGLTTANITLQDALYNNDLTTVSFWSNLASDNPQIVAYHTSSHVLDITGLTTSSNRTIETTYDTSAWGTGLVATTFTTLFSFIPYLWYAMLSVLPIVAIVVLWKR